MNKELELKLVNRFKILYQDYTSPMSQTCMCWGFEHGDGWNDIIWQLSLAIEEELGYTWLQERWFLFKKAFAKKWNDVIYKLSPVRQRKYRMEGAGTPEDPMRQVQYHYDLPRWDERIAQFLFGKTTKIGKFEVERMGVKNWVFYPNTGFAVSQVKEKFGTLRFYCPHSDRISRFVQIAGRLSAVTCESCGEYAKLRTDGYWVSTKCDKCYGTKATGDAPVYQEG